MLFGVLRYCILIGLGGIFLYWWAVLVAALLIKMFGPSFDQQGNINECVGCKKLGGADLGCYGCRYNPRYWDGFFYKGPSRKTLRRIRKVVENSGMVPRVRQGNRVDQDAERESDAR